MFNYNVQDLDQEADAKFRTPTEQVLHAFSEREHQNELL